MRVLFFLVAFLISLSSMAKGVDVQRKEVLLNDSWSFILKDISDASSESYDDSEWRNVMIPHDWAFEEGYKKDGSQGLKGGYASGGIGWYRKYFELEKKDIEDRRSFLNFDAIYMNSQVWINGNFLGVRPYGYISFEYEVTAFLHEGRNVISVRVDNSKEPSARWYHGCGIYGDVKLLQTAESRLVANGTFIANPSCSEKEAALSISSKVDIRSEKNGKFSGEYIITAPDGKVVYEQKKLKIGQDSVFRADLKIKNPDRWDVRHPVLYTLKTRLYEKGKVIDEVDTRFGVRSVEWDAEKGFSLNGRTLKIRGVCEHLEGGPVGAAWTENMIRWKIQALLAMGCNSIRTSHNPQVPKFYDLCDEMGVLVMDEIFDGWKRKAPEDYGCHAFDKWWRKDLSDWIKRDRNHPSVFIYSIGNETSGEIGKEILEACHREDSTRCVTSGHSASEYMDVYGVNGGSENQEFLDTYVPKGKAFIGTENPHTWQVRGYYRTKTWYRDGYRNPGHGPFFTPDLTDKEVFQYEWASPDKVSNGRQHYNSSYDNAYVRINVRRSIEYLRDKPWYSGTYRWTGFDYPGECGFPHGGWPFRAFMGGVLDLAGFEKDHYYLYQSQWTDTPMAHILPHWTHPYMEEGTEIPVFVYTTGKSVELFLNGRSLGKKDCGKTWDTMAPMWLVPWEPGELKAVAYDAGGARIAEEKQMTGEAPSRLFLKHEESYLTGNKEDLHVITIAEKDAKDVLYPYGENRIYFHVDGGTVFSAESGCPVDTETNYNAASRRAFFGLLRVFVRRTGNNMPIFYAASIMGDKRLKSSRYISMDVKALTMKGSGVDPFCKIYYTTDGSEPTVEDEVYTLPFKMHKKECVIKAIVVRNGKILFRMEEKFGPKEGIYWNEGEAVMNMAGQQAEEAALFRATVENKIKGFQSKGYVMLPAKYSSVSFYHENDGDARKVSVDFSYMMEKAGTVVVELVNGDKKIMKEITVPAQDAGKWLKGSFEGVGLERGANDLEFNLHDGHEIAVDWLDIK